MSLIFSKSYCVVIISFELAYAHGYCTFVMLLSEIMLLNKLKKLIVQQVTIRMHGSDPRINII